MVIFSDALLKEVVGDDEVGILLVTTISILVL